MRSKDPVTILSLPKAVECRKVPVGNVEGQRVHHVLVVIQRVKLCAGQRVPDLARTIVAPGDEPTDEHPDILVARLVERAVGQRQDVRLQHFE